jgi:branched-chain amino acid transport system substrate-binding protein
MELMKRLSAILSFLMLAGVLAACGGAAPTAPTGATVEAAATTVSGAATEVAPTVAAAATAVAPTVAAAATAVTGAATGAMPEDPLGVVEIAPGDPLVLAYAMVTSGANASLGEDARRGVEIALDDVSNTILDTPIELIGEDTGCSAEGGQAAATKLASNTQIVAIVGTSCSSEARVMAPVIDQAGMVMVSPSNTAPDLTAEGTHVQGYLRTAHNDEVQGRVAAEFAYNQLKVTKAATVHDGSPYAQGLATVFAENFRNLGGTITSEEAINVGDTDMGPLFSRLASAADGPPELVYYPIFVAEGGFITRQIRDAEGLAEAKLMGSDGIFSPDFVTAAGDAVTGMYLTSPDFSAFTGGYAEFTEKYEAKFGQPPISAFHAHAYDATNIILAAIEKVAVKGEDGTLYIPRQALRDALYATSGFAGLTGTITCAPNGDCADPKIAAYEVVNSDPSTWNPGIEETSNPKKVYP